jgi:hypothetical protein
MRCPKCRTEVSDWHFYCPNCHTLIGDYSPSGGKAGSGMVERAGMRLVNLILAALVISALVLMARAIKWNDLMTQMGLSRRDAGAPTEVKKEQTPRSNPSNARRKENSPAAPASMDTGKPEKKNGAESVREMPHKIEELSPTEASPSPPKPTPTPTKPAPNELVTSVAETKQANAPPRLARESVELGVEQVEVKNDGEVGYLTINSYAPARIYVDGQFSGLTPRTLRLASGDHQIRLIADGYEDWTRRIRLKSRQQVGIMASLKKAIAQN